MLGLRALVIPCARTRVPTAFSAEPCAKLLQSRTFTATAKQPAIARHPLLAPRQAVGESVSKPLVTLRSYRGVHRPSVTIPVQKAPVSQKLWQVAGVGAMTGIGLVALDGLRERAGPGVYATYVSERVTKTYGYVVGSLGLTAGFVTYIVRSGIHYRLATVSPLLMLGATLGGSIASMLAVNNLENKPAQHAAWLAFTGFTGLAMFPIAFMGGAIIQRAIIGTAAMVGSISLVAATTRSDAHLAMAGPLTVGLGVVFAASIGQVFLPASPLLYNIAVYGGLAVFGGLTYVDTQRMIQKAKFQQTYDPLKASVGIYLDIINIFWRMVAIMSNGGRKK